MWTEKENIMKWTEFLENKTEIVQHVLKTQYITLLPTCIKSVFKDGFLHAFKNANFLPLSLMSNEFKRIWKEMVVTQLNILLQFSHNINRINTEQECKTPICTSLIWHCGSWAVPHAQTDMVMLIVAFHIWFWHLQSDLSCSLWLKTYQAGSLHVKLSNINMCVKVMYFFKCNWMTLKNYTKIWLN